MGFFREYEYQFELNWTVFSEKMVLWTDVYFNLTGLVHYWFTSQLCFFPVRLQFLFGVAWLICLVYSCDSFCQIQVLCVPHLSFVFCLSPSLSDWLAGCQPKVEYPPPPPQHPHPLNSSYFTYPPAPAPPSPTPNHPVSLAVSHRRPWTDLNNQERCRCLTL